MRRFLALLILLSPLSLLADDDLGAEVKRFVEAYSLIEQHLADPVDPERAFYQGALPGMVRTLDPHSAFLDRDQFESLREMQRSTEKGFGSVVSLLPGRVIVLQILPDSPSARAGLSPGDEIVAINGYPLSHLTIEQLIGLLGQSRQQKAELIVQRAGTMERIPMTLAPEDMEDPTVQRTFFLKPGLAYIKLTSFELETAKELRAAIERLGGDDLKGLVLDFRRNPGGVVEAAVRVASFFLKPGQTILWIRGREGPREEVKVPAGFQPYEFPMALLVDSRTASAAELVAGALQDHDRATILGQPTFGKGIVQSVFDLSEGTAVALTTAKYLTPSGRSIQRPMEDCHLYALAACSEPPEPPEGFKTDAGRVVHGGGGITPDELVYPRRYSRFEAVMEGTNSFLDFVQSYLKDHPEISPDFEPTPSMLDDFQLFLSERRIRPDLAEWSATVEFIRSRLKQEVFNLKFGVAKGDEVEAQREPAVQAAMRVLESR